MNEEIKRVKQEPTVSYEILRVTGGRAPKVEVKVKVAGDYKIIKDKNFKPTLARLRDNIVAEIKEVESLLSEKKDE